MKRFITKRNIVILVVLLVGIGWFFGRPKGEVKVVRTATVERGDIVQTLTVTGKVQAEKRATLNFLSGGKLGFVRKTFGDPVTKGEWIAGLDTGDLAAAERAAYYNYLAYDANAKQVEDAVKGNDADESFTQKNARVSAQTARDKAYDAWISAQRAVQFSILKSPLNGMVTEISISTPGDSVSVADGVTVVDPATISFETEVNETDIGKVFVGQEAYVTLDAFGEEKYMGVVKRVGFATKTGDTGATVLPIWVELPKESLTKFKIGLNGDATLKLAESKNTLILPAEAVRDGKVTLKDKTEKEVQVGLESDFDVEIKSGLKEGDEVIIK